MFLRRHFIGSFVPYISTLFGIVWLISGISILLMSEQPRTSVKGIAISRLTSKPIPKTKIMLRRIEASRIGGSKIFWTVCDERGEFSFKFIPAGWYEIEAHSNAHSLAPTRVELREGIEEELTLELTPKSSWLQLILPQRTFMMGEKVSIGVNGFVLEDKMTIRIHEIDVQRMLKSMKEMPQLLRWEEFNSEWSPNEGNLRSFLKEYGRYVVARDVRISGRDGEGMFTQYVDVPIEHPGVYIVEMIAGKAQAYTGIIVTSIGAVIKWDGMKAFVYACHLKNGAPIRGAKVFIVNKKALKETGTTDANGILFVSLTDVLRDDEISFVVNHGSQLCLARLYAWQAQESKYKVHIYTDRTVYRPGDVIHFKGIVRIQNNLGYAVPKETAIELELRDPRGRRAWSGKALTNSFGTFHGSLKLPEEVPTGDATLVAFIDGEQHERTIPIAAYRKPEFAIKVRTERSNFLPDEIAHITVDAEYYFGVPVKNAMVECRVHRFELLKGYECDEWDESMESMEQLYGEEVESEATTTDENGRANIRLKMHYPKEITASIRESMDTVGWKIHPIIPPTYQNIVHISVTDIGERTVERSLTLLLHPASLRISVEPENYIVNPNKIVKVNIKVTDLNGKPVKGEKVKAVFGMKYFETAGANYKTYLIPLMTEVLTTSQSGIATWDVVPVKSGEWAVYAAVEDDGGRYDADIGEIYAHDEWLEQPQVDKQARLELMLSKRSFSVGEDAEVMLRSGFKNGHALVTVEGEQIYRHWLIRLDGKPKLIKFDIQPSYIPGIWICATAVDRKEMVETKAFIKVPTGAKELNVRISSSKQRCSPGESVEYTINVTDNSGRPVKAELSLSVVDEAIYAVKDESPKELVNAFYGPKPHDVVTVTSFPKLYFQTNKAGTASIRKHFPDTAFWTPSIVTDDDGTARIKVNLPDAITTWRATVKAVTIDTSLGVALHKLIVSKPLMVRLQSPRFLVEGDELEMVGIVHNETDGRKWLTVRLSCNGVDVEGDSECRLGVAPNSATKLTWKVKAKKHGYATLTLSAISDDGLRDAVQKRLRILPLATLYSCTKSGRLAGGETASIWLHKPKGTLTDVGEVKILLSPSPSGSILSALEFLTQYPYGCVEQTMSSFMPDVIVHRAWKELRWALPTWLEKELPKMVEHGLVRLYKYQHDDGSWGWCYYDDADIWMTAYVAYGLLECRNSGFEVDSNALKEAAKWLKEHLSWWGTPYNQNDYALALSCYVLTMLGERKLRMPQKGWLESATPKANALVAMAAHRLGNEAAFRMALTQLLNMARESVSECTWGSVEDTAWALRALLHAEGVSDSHERQRLIELSDKAANSLLSTRTESYWESTRQTAIAIIALVDYLKQRRWKPPDGTLTITLNGCKQKLRVDPKSAFLGDIVWRTGIEKAVEGDNELMIQFDGTGTLYYTATLKCMRQINPEGRYIASGDVTVLRHYELITYGRDGKEHSTPLKELRCRKDDILKCTLTVQSSKPLNYFFIEEPIPAGCELIERGEIERDEWHWLGLWYAEKDVRDDKIVFFIREMSPGKRKISYMMRVECAGKFAILPTVISAMYEPSIVNRGSPQIMIAR